MQQQPGAPTVVPRPDLFTFLHSCLEKGIDPRHLCVVFYRTRAGAVSYQSGKTAKPPSPGSLGESLKRSAFGERFAKSPARPMTGLHSSNSCRKGESGTMESWHPNRYLTLADPQPFAVRSDVAASPIPQGLTTLEDTAAAAAAAAWRSRRSDSSSCGHAGSLTLHTDYSSLRPLLLQVLMRYTHTESTGEVPLLAADYEVHMYLRNHTGFSLAWGQDRGLWALGTGQLACFVWVQSGPSAPRSRNPWDASGPPISLSALSLVTMYPSISGF